MPFFIDNTGTVQQVEVAPEVHKAAFDAQIDVPTYINNLYPAADTSKGSAFTQICASVGLVLPGKNDFGIRAAKVSDILDGKVGAQAAGLNNTSDRGSPFGQAARSLYPAAIVTMVEDILTKDRATDTVVFDQMVGQEMSIPTENFIQPVISYQGANGPESAKMSRVTEFAEPTTMLRLSTAERIRSLPAFGMGIEFSDKARQALTIDVVALSIARYMQVEKDSRVYNYLSALFSGDSDLVIGAVSAVTTTSLDAAATGGVITHKAWVKFLARNRKFRQIDYIICDIDAYLKIEGRTGRPGTVAYDPRLAVIDPQAVAANQANVGFGNNVKFFIVDDAASGGPVPANTIWALDSRKAITRVTNVGATYSASEAFAMRRSTAMRFDYSEACFRTFGDTDTRAFDVLTIS